MPSYLGSKAKMKPMQIILLVLGLLVVVGGLAAAAMLMSGGGSTESRSQASNDRQYYFDLAPVSAGSDTYNLSFTGSSSSVASEVAAISTFTTQIAGIGNHASDAPCGGNDSNHIYQNSSFLIKNGTSPLKISVPQTRSTGSMLQLGGPTTTRVSVSGTAVVATIKVCNSGAAPVLSYQTVSGYFRDSAQPVELYKLYGMQ